MFNIYVLELVSSVYYTAVIAVPLHFIYMYTLVCIENYGRLTQSDAKTVRYLFMNTAVVTNTLWLRSISSTIKPRPCVVVLVVVVWK